LPSCSEEREAGARRPPPRGQADSGQGDQTVKAVAAPDALADDAEPLARLPD
jgi:hypothetical protein